MSLTDRARPSDSFRVRLSLGVAALVLLALSALTALSGAALWRLSLRDLDTALREQSAVVARVARAGGDPARSGSLLGALTQGPDVADARVTRGGAVTWNSGFRNMPPATQLGLSTLRGWRLLRTREGDLTVQVGRPLAGARAAVAAYARASVPLTLLMSLVGGLIAWLLVGREVRPLTLLARRVARLDADEPIPGRERGDEIGALARALAASLAELRERRAAERAFVARASHELRTPVAALQAELEFALSKQRPQEEYRAALELARRQAAHLERLSVNLLTLTRLEGAPPRVGALDLWEVAADAVDRFVPLALREGLSLDLTGAPSTVRGDPVLLARLLDNLLQNAVRYTPQGGVTVHVEEGALTVEDSGVGFPQDVLSRPGELFRGEAGQGFGVGLSVIQAIARAHGAELRFARRAEGGTRVTVTFPPP